MPRNRSTIASAHRRCVNHGWRCAWAGGPWPEESTASEGRAEQCRQATVEDRARGRGIFAPPMVSTSEVLTAEDEIGVMAARALKGEAAAVALAESRKASLPDRLARIEVDEERRARQPWREWIVEERKAVEKVDALSAEILASAGSHEASAPTEPVDSKGATASPRPAGRAEGPQAAPAVAEEPASPETAVPARRPRKRRRASLTIIRPY